MPFSSSSSLFLNHYDLKLRHPLANLRNDGWDGLRRNVWTLADALRIEGQHAATGVRALFLLDYPPGPEVVELAKAVSNLGHGAIEVGNEWNRKGVSPETARMVWLECYSAMNPLVSLVTGGTSDISAGSYDWLARATEGLPRSIIIGIHGYPGQGDPQDPRDDPKRYSRYVGRTHWITEVGWDRGPHPRPFPLCWLNQRRSEQDQADCFAADARLAREASIPFYSAYQVADGPDSSNPDDCHGLYRDDGTARPAVSSLVTAFKG